MPNLVEFVVELLREFSGYLVLYFLETDVPKESLDEHLLLAELLLGLFRERTGLSLAALSEKSLEREQALFVMLFLLDLLESHLGGQLVRLGKEHDFLAVFLLQGLLLL